MLWMIIVGLIVGAFAKLLMPGRDPGGFIITILLGIVGSIAGSIGRAIGWYKAAGGFLSLRFSARCPAVPLSGSYRTARIRPIARTLSKFQKGICHSSLINCHLSFRGCAFSRHVRNQCAATADDK
jgi:uncharacterized membrane protein YeaQ/YmgE (transglycosylase-associated protein family)